MRSDMFEPGDATGASKGPLAEASRRRDKMVLSYSTHLAECLKPSFSVPDEPA